MLELSLKPARGRTLRILCVAAHCDDIEIGCGGTLLALLRRQRAHVSWLALSGTPERAAELRRSSAYFLKSAAGSSLDILSFRDGYFPGQYTQIKEAYAGMARSERPDVIFTHQSADRHQDHRVIAELTRNLFRDHLILEYEIPKFDGGLTTPNVYFELTPAQVDAKVKALLKFYPTQRAKRWFTPDTFRALMRLRGIESGCARGWAEGFHVDKCCIAA
jgi:LmbE family N-acetylglucosaminyl deacetylase